MSATSFAADLFPNVDAAKGIEIAQASLDTLIMLATSLPLSLLIGLLLGVVMFISGKGQPQSHPWLHNTLAFVVNILRSVPFIILMISLIPVTLAVMGTSLGVRGAILPLVIGAAPFFARLAEAALREVDRGVLEAATAMGATTRQLITGVLLPEARPGLISAATITAIALVGFTAMGGAIGSGGLGDLAYRDGYQRSHTDVAVITVALLLVLVQLIQVIGDRLTAHFNRR